MIDILVLLPDCFEERVRRYGNQDDLQNEAQSKRDVKSCGKQG